MKGLLLVFLASVGFVGSASAEVDLEQMVTICASCHGIGAGGAPKIGSESDWAPRLEKGMSVLVESVKSGVPGTLMSGGICRGCTDEEIETVVKKIAGVEG